MSLPQQTDTLYFSQLVLNERSREVQRDVRDPYQMHRTLCHALDDACFANAEARARARLLFRVEQDGPLYVMVQSKHKPDWTRFHANAPTEYLRGEVQCKAIEPDLRLDSIWMFRLRANPTKREGGQPAGQKGKRVGIYREAERLAWLERKAQASGFRLLQVNVRDEGRAHHLSREGKTTSIVQVRCEVEGRKTSFSAARFDGTLQVMDTELFQATLAKGIGAGKGFGFGLLSLAKPR